MIYRIQFILKTCAHEVHMMCTILTVGAQKLGEGVLLGIPFRPQEQHVLAKVRQPRYLRRIGTRADVHVHRHGRGGGRRIRAQEHLEAVGERVRLVRALVERRPDDAHGRGCLGRFRHGRIG